MPWFLVSCLALLIPASLAAQPVKVPEDPWQLTRDIEIVSRWPQRDRLHDDRITADLYRLGPRAEFRLPSSSIRAAASRHIPSCTTPASSHGTASLR